MIHARHIPSPLIPRHELLGVGTPLPATNISQLIRQTQHFEFRSEERNLPAGVRDYILQWAKTPVFRSGQIFLTLRRKDLPEEEQESPLAKRSMGWVLVLTHEDALVTCYWNKDAVASLRKKPRKSLAPNQLEERYSFRQRAREQARQAKKTNRKAPKVLPLKPFSPTNPFAA